MDVLIDIEIIPQKQVKNGEIGQANLQRSPLCKNENN
jgi:hypothetical protein